MHIATISSKRQITLPKSLLEELGLGANKKVLVTKEKNALKIKPVKKSVTEELSGSLTKFVHPSKLGVPWKKIKGEVGEAIAEHAATEGME